MIIFSDSTFGDGLQENLTGFQLLKSAAPNSTMAISYEHLIFLLIYLFVKNIRFGIRQIAFVVRARASRPNKQRACKPSTMSRFDLSA